MDKTWKHLRASIKKVLIQEQLRFLLFSVYLGHLYTRGWKLQKNFNIKTWAERQKLNTFDSDPNFGRKISFRNIISSFSSNSTIFNYQNWTNFMSVVKYRFNLVAL